MPTADSRLKSSATAVRRACSRSRCSIPSASGCWAEARPCRGFPADRSWGSCLSVIAVHSALWVRGLKRRRRKKFFGTFCCEPRLKGCRMEWVSVIREFAKRRKQGRKMSKQQGRKASRRGRHVEDGGGRWQRQEQTIGGQG